MSSATTAAKPRILIVDDCATSRRMEEVILRRTGHEILTATNGEEAVRMATVRRPDLIVLDLQMPKMGGLEALKGLKRSPLTREVPVIVVTTSGDAAAYRAAAESGCDAFLTKPFEAETLLLSVEQNLSAGRARGLRSAQGRQERPDEPLAVKPDQGAGVRLSCS
jgi:CheY-like chemotaxis protein